MRQIKVSTELTAYLSLRWPHLQQVAEVTRTVTCKGKTTQEVLSLITDLTPQQASPHQLLQINRGHWHIENGLHYVRDVDFGEDRSRLRSGNAPQVMAALRNLVITLIHRLGSAQIEALRRYFAYHPDILPIILSKLLPSCFKRGASNNSQTLSLLSPREHSSQRSIRRYGDHGRNDLRTF